MIVSMSRLPVHPLAGQSVGYARISSASQNVDGQTDALAGAGCEKVFADTARGSWPSGRS
jgi:DNA invertase Pin-like site-specific DNA recombinase